MLGASLIYRIFGRQEHNYRSLKLKTEESNEYELWTDLKKN